MITLNRNAINFLTKVVKTIITLTTMTIKKIMMIIIIITMMIMISSKTKRITIEKITNLITKNVAAKIEILLNLLIIKKNHDCFYD